VEYFAENAACSAAFACVAHSAVAAAPVLRLRSHWLIGGRRANWHAPLRDCSAPQAWELPQPPACRDLLRRTDCGRCGPTARYASGPA
jgi:hypothetical protein